MTCNALEWIASRGGLDARTNRIRFDNPGVLQALDHAREWVNGERAISPNAEEFEEESLQMFLHGKAAFLRSWTSAYTRLEQAGIEIGVRPLPTRDRGYKSFGVVGGWQLAVPKYSLNKPSAIEFIRYLSRKEVQKWRAREGAYQPTIENIAVQVGLPPLNVSNIQPIIRPSSQLGDRYDEVSKCISRSVHAALNRKSRDEIEQDIITMKNCIERESKGIEREYEEPLKGEG